MCRWTPNVILVPKSNKAIIIWDYFPFRLVRRLSAAVRWQKKRRYIIRRYLVDCAVVWFVSRRAISPQEACFYELNRRCLIIWLSPRFQEHSKNIPMEVSNIENTPIAKITKMYCILSKTWKTSKYKLKQNVTLTNCYLSTPPFINWHFLHSSMPTLTLNIYKSPRDAVFTDFL